MGRVSLLTLIFLLVSVAFASQSQKDETERITPKRKRSSPQSLPEFSYISEASLSSSENFQSSSGLTAAPVGADQSKPESLANVIAQAAEIFAARPVGEFIVRDRFDVDVFFPDSERDKLPAYRCLLEKIVQRKFQHVYFAVMSGEFDVGRWFFNRLSKHFMTYLHLIFIYFEVSQFKQILLWLDESYLLLPCSNGHNFMKLAIGLNDDSKREYLRPILTRRAQECEELVLRFQT